MIIKVKLKIDKTMKKTYISPKTDIVSVELQKMIAASSDPITLTEEGGTGQLIDSAPSGTTEVLSRGSSLWDDDEE
jgi:hypothetical protein